MIERRRSVKNRHYWAGGLILFASAFFMVLIVFAVADWMAFP